MLISCEFEYICIQSIISVHHKHICTHTTESHKGKHVVKDQKEISKREVAILFYSSILYYVWRKLSVHPAQTHTYASWRKVENARALAYDGIGRQPCATGFLGGGSMCIWWHFLSCGQAARWNGAALIMENMYWIRDMNRLYCIYCGPVRRHLRLFAENASGSV